VLNIEAGTVVKFIGGTLTVAGTLAINGTAANPVTLTTAKDDTTGGDTNGDGAASTPAANDWAGITVTGGSLTATHLNIEYVYTALRLGNASADISSSSITNSGGTAVTLSDGSSASIDASFASVAQIVTTDSSSSAELRGSARDLTGTGPFVSSCRWGTGACLVDASYFDWGSTEGPYPAGGSVMACGSVIASPWSFHGTVAGRSIWSIGNCDGSPYSPASSINESQASYQAALSARQALCAQGPAYADACEIVKTNQQCFKGASDIVQSQSLFPLAPNLSSPEAVGDFVAEQGSDYLKTSTNSSVSTAAGAASHALKVKQVIGTFSALSSAYDRCH
jgi:hypothetical protein